MKKKEIKVIKNYLKEILKLYDINHINYIPVVLSNFKKNEIELKTIEANYLLKRINKALNFISTEAEIKELYSFLVGISLTLNLLKKGDSNVD